MAFCSLCVCIIWQIASLSFSLFVSSNIPLLYTVHTCVCIRKILNGNGRSNEMRKSRFTVEVVCVFLFWHTRERNDISRTASDFLFLYAFAHQMPSTNGLVPVYLPLFAFWLFDSLPCVCVCLCVYTCLRLQYMCVCISEIRNQSNLTLRVLCVKANSKGRQSKATLRIHIHTYVASRSIDFRKYHYICITHICGHVWFSHTLTHIEVCQNKISKQVTLDGRKKNLHNHFILSIVFHLLAFCC